MGMLLTKEPEISKRGTELLDRKGFWITRQWMQCCSGVGGKIQITLSRAMPLEGSELDHSRVCRQYCQCIF